MSNANFEEEPKRQVPHSTDVKQNVVENIYNVNSDLAAMPQGNPGM
jgi:hypothetical protein